MSGAASCQNPVVTAPAISFMEEKEAEKDSTRPLLGAILESLNSGSCPTSRLRGATQNHHLWIIADFPHTTSLQSGGQ